MKLSRYFCLIFLVVSLSLAASVPAAAKDKWISLHTKSFLIVSNGSSDDTRRMGRAGGNNRLLENILCLAGRQHLPDLRKLLRKPLQPYALAHVHNERGVSNLCRLRHKIGKARNEIER